MANAVFGSPLQAVEGETKTLSSSAAGYVAIKPGFHEVKLYCASAWRLALAPALRVVSYYSASADTYTNYAPLVTDGSTSTHLPLDAMATTDILYIGTTDPILGLYYDVGTNANAVTATQDVEYCSTAQVVEGNKIVTAIAFTDVAGDSDGTDSTGTQTGATLEQDGVYVWTLPSVKRSPLLGVTSEPLYWMRWSPSAALSATVDINEIIPVYKNANYAYMEAGMEYQFSLNLAKVGGLTVKATSGSPTLNISWISH